MPQSKESPQFQRTDRAIMDALVRLLQEKPFEKITVQDILDETPVTRGTFYHHYHDKYEVAERLQEKVLTLEDDILEQLSSVPLNQFPEIIQVQFQHAQYLIQALLLIHTEQVDIQKRLREKYRQIYLDSHAHPAEERVLLEADLYSAILTTYQMHLMQKLPADLSVEQINQTFFNVFLRLFGLEDRPDLAEFLKKNVKIVSL